MRILVVDNHPVVAAGCRVLFGDDDVELFEAQTAGDGEAAYGQVQPDVAIIDVNLPDRSGFLLTRDLVRQHEAAKILVFTMHDDAMFAARSLESGAKGYLDKQCDPAELRAAVFKLAAGEFYLSDRIAQKLALMRVGKHGAEARIDDRDREILQLLVEGNTLTQIAGGMGLSYKTIAKLCARMRQALGAENQVDLVSKAIDRGWIILRWRGE